MSIGEKIRDLRKLHNRSQEDLALELNVSRQTINKWESDKAQPNVENIGAICKIFNISSDYFISTPEDIARQETAATGTTVVVVKDNSTTFIIWAIVVGLLFVVATVVTCIFGYVSFYPYPSAAEYVATDSIDGAEFAAMLSITIILAIGEALLIFFAVKNRKQKKTNLYKNAQ